MALLTVRDIEMVPGTTLDQDLVSKSLDTAEFSKCAFQITWSDLTGTIDGTYIVQGSNDGENWSGISNETVLSGASGSDIVVTEAYCKFLRLSILNKQITGGTISATAVLKRA